MRRAAELHERAMDLAELASVAKLKGELAEAARLVREAFDNERRAADLVARNRRAEPTRSILHRSAACLAIDCGELHEAERLISVALAGHPPPEIAEELQDLLAHLRCRPEASSREVSVRDPKSRHARAKAIRRLWGRFDLGESVSEQRLATFIAALSDTTGLAGSIIRMPPPGVTIADGEVRIDGWRIAGAFHGNALCRRIEKAARGCAGCTQSDLTHARTAFDTGEPVFYECPLGLANVVAAVRVAGRHVASVYLGQARSDKLGFEAVWQGYVSLVRSSPGAQAESERTLRACFERIPVMGEQQFARIVEIVRVLADLISERASHCVALRALEDLEVDVGNTLDLRLGLGAFLNRAMELVNADTGHIYLLDEPGQTLRSFAMNLGDGLEDSMVMELRTNGPGIGPHVARTGEVRRFDAAEEIDKFSPAFAGARLMRSLESLIALPVRYEEQTLGILDVGSRRANAFNDSDVGPLRSIAARAGAFVQHVREREELLRVFMEDDLHRSVETLVQQVERLFGGIGCSVFLRPPDSEDARLFATNEFPPDKIGSLSYSPGVGLTGWVLQRGVPMRIDAGPRCRDEPALQGDYQGAVWEGLRLEHKLEGARHDREYDRSRPFLAVPIRAPDGAVLGVIRISDRRTGSFTYDDERRLVEYANCIGRRACARR